MALALGFFLFLMGALTFYLWLPATWPFLQGLISFSLLFWGFLILLIAYSERKARRELARALHDEGRGARHQEPEKQTPTPNA